MKFPKKFARGVLILAFGAAVAGGAAFAINHDQPQTVQVDQATPAQKLFFTGTLAGPLESMPPQYSIRLDTPINGQSTITVDEDQFTEAQRKQLQRGKAVSGEYEIVNRDRQAQVNILSVRVINPAERAPGLK